MGQLATISSKGQLVIPAELRKKYRLNAWTLVDVAVVEGDLAGYFGKDEPARCIAAAREAISIIPIGESQALEAALLRLHYKLGLADCFAAELAMRLGQRW